MVKNRFVCNCFTITALAFISSLSGYSQKNLTEHFIAAWAAPGYANMIHDVEKATPLGGGGGLIGLGYEFNYGHFILQVGGEFDIKHVQNNLKPFQREINMYDTEGDEVIFNYQFSQYVEKYNVGYINIPILLGAQFPSQYYFLVGGKLGINVMGYATINSRLKTYGIYPQFIDDFEGMPDHFYVNEKNLKNSNSVGFNLNMIASVEFGRNIFPSNRNSRVHYRLGGFVDYGLTNLNSNQINGNGDIVNLPVSTDGTKNVLDVQQNSMFTSNLMKDKAINSLLVGVKFTVLFNAGGKSCNCRPENEPKKQKHKTRCLWCF